MIARTSSAAASHSTLKPRRSKALSRLSLTAACLGVWAGLSAQPALARDCYDFVLEREPGYQAMSAGNYAAALSAWNRFLTACPDQIHALMQRSLVKLALDQPAAAFEDYVLAERSAVFLDDVQLVQAFVSSYKQEPAFAALIARELQSPDQTRQVPALLIHFHAGGALDPIYSVMIGAAEGSTRFLAHNMLRDRLFKTDVGPAHPLDALAPRIEADLQSGAQQAQIMAITLLYSYLEQAPSQPQKPPATLPGALQALLIAQVETGSPETRRLAIMTLAQAGNTASLPAMRRQLSLPDQDPDVMLAALSALTALRDPEAGPVLRELLNKPVLRLQVVRSLEALDDRASAPALIALLSSSDDRQLVAEIAPVMARWQVREAVAPLFRQLELAKTSDYFYGPVADALATLGGPEVFATLQTHAFDASLSEDVRYSALRALGKSLSQDPSRIPLFVKALEAPERLIRVAAVLSFTDFAHPEAAAALQARWAREDQPNLREELLLALLSQPALDRAAWIARGLREPHEFVRTRAAERIDDFAPEAVDLYTLALQDSGDDVRRAAIQGLPAKPLPGLAPLLIESLKQGYNSLRADAALALAHYRTPATEQALKQALYADESEEVRQAARATLKGWGLRY